MKTLLLISALMTLIPLAQAEVYRPSKAPVDISGDPSGGAPEVGKQRSPQNTQNSSTGEDEGRSHRGRGNEKEDQEAKILNPEENYRNRPEIIEDSREVTKDAEEPPANFPSHGRKGTKQ